MSEKRALITGARGQDGSYLGELLVDQGFAVTGLDKPDRVEAARREDVGASVEYHSVDLLDPGALGDLFLEMQPTHVFHLASASFVPASWDDPAGTSRFTVESTVNVLETMRRHSHTARFLGAASAEIFGRPAESPQDESTPIRPVTPYGAAKAHAYFLTQMYRSRYGLHCGSAILYNHESPRRPIEFLPRKVAHSAAAIKLGLQSDVSLGNLDAVRDWSFAGDVVRAMFLMLEAEDPDDYVIASGAGHTVRDLVDTAFAHVGLDYKDVVKYDDAFHRPEGGGAASVGNSARARAKLAWEPTLDFVDLVRLLVDADLERLQRGGGLPASEAAGT